MPLEPFQRGSTFWVRGRCDGIDGYVRRSLGTSDKAVALAKIREIERRARQRAILGDDAPRPEDELTFATAVTHYPAKPAEARFLMRIVPTLGPVLVKNISGRSVKQLARDLYPLAAADTWRRQVISPVRAVVNNAHELGLCPPLRIKAFTRDEVIEQDRRRGRTSRVPKQPGSWPWLLAFRQQALKNRKPYMAALALFMFTTGARISQALQIRRDTGLNLAAGKILMPAAKGHPEQWVDIGTELVVDLANLRARNGRLFGYTARTSIYVTWKRICKDAGIDYLPPHSAGRHGFGTELIVRQGVDPATVTAAGRWSSPRVPLETYSHAEDTAAKVKSAFEKGRSGTNPVQPDSANRRKSL